MTVAKKKNKSAIRPGYYLRGLPVNDFEERSSVFLLCKLKLG
jgi:hypothetical protein